MHPIAIPELIELLTARTPPCISLYQPTSRRRPDNQQDPIRFGNLLKEAESSLRSVHPIREVRALLEPFRALLGKADFWNHRLDGMAVFGSPGTFRVVELQRPVAELVVVAGAFQIRPLIRALQSADRFQILCLDRREVRLLEGNRDVLDEVELDGVPRTITEALGGELTEPHLTVASYGNGSWSPGASHGVPRMHHGHGSRKDEIGVDVERFFRVVDRAVLERHSRPSGLPLMLAALTEYHPVFRDVSHNPFLMAEGVEHHPDGLAGGRLLEEAWARFEPQHRERLAKEVDRFLEARSKGMGTDDLEELAGAATAGRVDTLLVDADRRVPGKVLRPSGRIRAGEFADPEIGDLLDELAELTILANGRVVVVPTAFMPPGVAAAARYRY